ncbi:nitroreductase family protein [Actinomadura oligospora]|uniref:nitroreductase family protein n=1 Tax=Actinomadura oligospora TaxID=111804 RepID=UPI00047AD5E1|nr:nitroreductase family protein [Actinomadura oligospora]
MAGRSTDEPQREQPEAVRVLLSRTAVRQFTDQPVGDDLVGPMSEALVAAPSASNRQAWAFVLVRDRRVVRLVQAFSPGVLATPPLIVVACFDRSRGVGDTGERYDECLLCVAMAVQNLLLAAHALGLGGCPVASFRERPLRRVLGLPAHIDPILLVSVGHPVRLNPHPVRRDPSEVIHHDVWSGGDAPRAR